MFSKIDVIKANAHPLFVFLEESQPGWTGTPIRWNFTKFLCNRKGVYQNQKLKVFIILMNLGIPVRRYATTTAPNDIEGDIIALLKE